MRSHDKQKKHQANQLYEWGSSFINRTKTQLRDYRCSYKSGWCNTTNMMLSSTLDSPFPLRSRHFAFGQLCSNSCDKVPKSWTQHKRFAYFQPPQVNPLIMATLTLRWADFTLTVTSAGLTGPWQHNVKYCTLGLWLYNLLLTEVEKIPLCFHILSPGKKHSSDQKKSDN